MKTKRISPILAVAYLAVLITLRSNGQAPQVTESDAAPKVFERGPHQTVYQTIKTFTDDNGDLISETGFYTTLATGMAYWDPNTGQWQDSVAAFEIFPDGAIARKTQHQVVLAPNPNTANAVDLLMSDGQRMISHVVGLSFYDRTSGQSVLIATIRDSQGAVLPGNDQVVYPDAFANVSADLRYRVTLAGLEQDIILREQPPAPDAFGLDPTSTRLEVITEFVQAPAPTIEMRVLKEETDPQRRQGMVEPDFVDDFLDFGPMQIGLGRVLQLTNQADDPAQPVASIAKHWENAGNRLLLFESVDLPDIANLLKDLPANQQANLNKPDRSKVMTSRKEILPTRLENKKSTNTVLVAQASLKGKGLVLDYYVASSSSNYVFRGDSTYYVTNQVNLTGSTRIEGGTVIKYGTSSSADLTINGAIDCQTAIYRPATFTAKDDNSLGEAISGSTGSPGLNSYGHVAIVVATTTSSSLAHLRVSYVRGGVDYASGGTHTLSHSQFNFNNTAVFTYGNADVSLRNLLIDDLVDTVFLHGPGTIRGEHLTIHKAIYLKTEPNGPQNMYLTNSLVIGVTNLASFTAVNTITNSTDIPSLFQTVGGASHYLSNGSANRNAGISTINSTLLSDLKKRTTYPPIVLTSDFTINTMLSPQAQRDTDTPDLGFHYSPLDWIVSDRVINNATVLMTNGAAVGYYGGSAFKLQAGSKLISEGKPDNLNRLVRYQSVQEQSNTNWISGGDIRTIKEDLTSGTKPEARFRFTDFPLPANTANHFGLGNQMALLAYTDCQLYGGGITYNSTGSSGRTVAFTNNIFERVIISLANADDPVAVYARNNLFRNGPVLLTATNNNAWAWHDNLFDNVFLTQNAANITNSNNGYLATTRITPTNVSDVILSSFIYTNGPLGNFYQYSTNLYDRGSRNANVAGLYHYTVKSSLVKETTSVVDIGFHYVATDSQGNPLDTDSDGLPDYFEDRNGNVTVDSGETDWNSATDFGLKVWITQPKSNSILP